MKRLFQILAILAATPAVADNPSPRFKAITLDTPLASSAGGTGSASGDASALTATAPGSSTARTLAARAADVFNVADYGGNIQSALTAAAAGGVVKVPVGSYTIKTALRISSNTKLACDQGAIITAATATGWTGQLAGLVNANNAASSLTDHDISVEGCSFVFTGSNSGGGFHHIEFRMASHIRVTRNAFTAGGDGTAMLGTVDTVVADNYMIAATNACWDHWEAPASFVVRSNYCTTNGYGVLVTGTNTAEDLAGQAVGGSITDNTISIVAGTAGAAGVWLNGLGVAGAGASNIVVSGNFVSGDGGSALSCFKVSGLSKNDSFFANTCRNAVSPSIGMAGTPDAGGSPVNTIVSNNLFDGITVQPTDIAAIQLVGTGMQAYQNRVTGGSYNYCVWLGGTNNIALGNVCDAAAVSMFSLSGAVNPIAGGPGAAGGLTLVATVTANSTSQWLQFTSLPTGFNRLRLTCDNIKPANNNVGAGLQVGEGATPTWQTGPSYRYTGVGMNSAGAAANPFSTNDTWIKTYNFGLANNKTYSLTADVTPNAAGNYALINVTYYWPDAGNGPTMSWATEAATWAADTNPITAIRFGVSAGNIASGSCSLYALSN